MALLLLLLLLVDVAGVAVGVVVEPDFVVVVVDVFVGAYYLDFVLFCREGESGASPRILCISRSLLVGNLSPYGLLGST